MDFYIFSSYIQQTQWILLSNFWSTFYSNMKFFFCKNNNFPEMFAT